MNGDYAKQLVAALGQTPNTALAKVSNLLLTAIDQERKVFVFGNGGSAALATHMAGDIGKLTALDTGGRPNELPHRRLRISSLTDNLAWITALANDLDYADVFLEQLKHLLDPGDVVIAISGSGASPNVIRALRYARLRGAVSVAFTGSRPSADEMRALCDVTVQAPVALMEQIEDLHVIYHHMIARDLMARLSPDAAHNRPALLRGSAPVPGPPSRNSHSSCKDDGYEHL